VSIFNVVKREAVKAHLKLSRHLEKKLKEFQRRSMVKIFITSGTIPRRIETLNSFATVALYRRGTIMSLIFVLITNKKYSLFSSFEFCTARSRIDTTFLCARSVSPCLSQTSNTQVERQISRCCCLHQGPRCKVEQTQDLLRLPQEVKESPCSDALYHIPLK